MKEIDCMTELNSMFSVPSAVGGTIFRTLSQQK
jgi:hypothetical protein